MADQSTDNSYLDRRRFFKLGVWIIGGIFSFLLGLPLIGYAVSVVFKKTAEQWVAVCPVGQISPDEPRQFRVAFKGENAHVPYDDVRAVFVISRGKEILAFTNVCTHMACSVRWVKWREQILCPCHGGTYDRWGNLAGGPPAHSLPLFATKVEGGTLYIANRLTGRGA